MIQAAAFQSLCDGLNRRLQARQVPSQARYEGKTIHILDSATIPKELIESIFIQAWHESECVRSSYQFTLQKGGAANWKISFKLSEESLRKEQHPTQILSGIETLSKLTLKQEITQATLKAVQEFLNKHEGTEGIWYPADYRKCLLEGYDIEMPDAMNEGYANDRYFHKTGPFAFVLKEGVRASEALMAFLKGPTVADCGNATAACYYKAVLDILGADCFDRIFGLGPFALRINEKGITSLFSPISILSDFTESAKHDEKGRLGKRPLSIGDECHIQGLIFYGNKHPMGSGGGFNVIYQGDNEEGEQLFVGHGLAQPSTEREIIHHLIAAYNEARTAQDLQRINEVNQPHLYDPAKNMYLKYYDQFPLVGPMTVPGKFFGGYWSGSPRCLDADAIALVKGAEDPLQMMSALKIAYS